jgi:hypothetical protein
MRFRQEINLAIAAPVRSAAARIAGSCAILDQLLQPNHQISTTLRRSKSRVGKCHENQGLLACVH